MVYLDLVMGLNFCVDFLLLLGTNQLAGFPARPGRCALAAGLGGIYGGLCLLPRLLFLAFPLWRLVFLAMMAVICFGFDRSALRRGTLFVLLSMALGGIALGLGRGGGWTLIGAAAGVALLCILGFGGRITGQKYVTVEIRHSGKHSVLTALLDTGNTLRDPITGESVLVAGPEAARTLLGLTPGQLASPIESLSDVPGLRLIPYRAVGQSGGMLLGIRPEEVRIAGQRRQTIVAFAPESIGNEGYQALAGGIL